MCPRCALGGALFGGHRRAVPAGTPSDLRPGGMLAHFEILDELGRGAMGRVWLARDTRLDRLVALKTLPAGANDSLLGARLEREARTVAALRHPHLIAVHDLGRAGDDVWLAMEFAEGGDLRTKLQERLFTALEAAELGGKLARALSHAHAAGVLHRDLKPSNILLDERGEPKLADFGLAASRHGTGDLTLTGQLLGTPAYMAPEALSPDRVVGPASDLYSLGAVLYETLTGRPPFVGDTPAMILAAVPLQEPVAPGRLRPGLPRDLETIVLKCLEKDPARRYGGAEQLAGDLEAFAAGRPISARPVSVAGRAWRWARREPRLAGAVSAAALSLVAIAVVSSVAAVRIERARSRATAEAERATRAEATTREELRAALLAEAKARRLSGRMGQRFDTLATLHEAAKVRPGEDLRTEAILTLTLPDVRAPRPDVHARDNNSQALALDVERDRFAVEIEPGRWQVRSARDNALQLTLEGGGARGVASAAFSADGGSFVVRTEAGVTFVWSLAFPVAPRLRLEGRRYLLQGGVTFYGPPDALSPDGAVLASTLPDGGFSLHRVADGVEFARVPTPQRLTHVVFSRDGKQLAVGRGLRGGHGEASFFLGVCEVARPAELRVLPAADGFQTMDWSADGKLLLLGASTTQVLEADGGRRLASFRDTEASAAYFGPGDRMVFTVSKTGGFRAWELTTGEPLFRAVFGSSSEFGISADRTRMLRTQGSTDLGLYLFEQPEVAKTMPSIGTDGWDNAARLGSCLAFSPDGRWLAQSVWGAVYVREAATGRLRRTLNFGTPNDFTSAVFATDGRAVLAGSEAAGVVRWPFVAEADGRLEFGDPVTLEAEPGFVVSDQTADGKKLLLVDHRRAQLVKVLTLDGAAPTVRWSFPRPSRAVFLEGGAMVLANGLGGIGKQPLQLFDAASGRAVRDLGVTQGYEISRSGDGAWVAIGTGSQASELRRTSDWSKGPALPAEIQGAGKATAFSPDGKVVAIARGPQVHLVRLTDGAVLARLEAAQSGGFAPNLAFSPDGRRLAVLWRLGQLTLWDLDQLHRELAALGLDW